MRGDFHGETVTLLRAITRHGWKALASDESLICYYCGCDAEYVKRPKHRDGCLYVRAKSLLAKLSSSNAQ